jgi:hypothetical protein
MNMEFISLVRQDFYIFTRALHEWKYWKSCLTREINFIFIKKHWISSMYFTEYFYILSQISQSRINFNLFSNQLGLVFAKLMQQVKLNTIPILMHQILRSLQWYSGRKSWKSEKKMWKLYKSQDNQILCHEIELNRRIELCMREIFIRLEMNLFSWPPMRIRFRIDPPHPLVCRKRRLNGAVLRMRPGKPRSRVTASVAR